MNRIAQDIKTVEKKIAAKLKKGDVTQDALDELNRKLDMEPLEYSRFQDLKSIAVMDDTLSMDEGMTVYEYLGNSPETFNGQSVAVKVILTRLFGKLMVMQGSN